MGEVIRKVLTTIVDVYIPSGIDICGERAEPEYIDDIDGDFIQYSGESYDHDWEIYIDANGREFYVRASIDGEELCSRIDVPYDAVEDYILDYARMIERELML